MAVYIAYTVVRATQQVSGKGQFWGVRICNLWTDRLKIWHTWLVRRCVDLGAIFHKIEYSVAQGLAGNMVKCAPSIHFLYFFTRDFSGDATE